MPSSGRPRKIGLNGLMQRDEIWFVDAIHTLPRESFRRPITKLTPVRLEEVCQILKAATGC